jgi:hypothetical protein
MQAEPFSVLWQQQQQQQQQPHQQGAHVLICH